MTDLWYGCSACLGELVLLLLNIKKWNKFIVSVTKIESCVKLDTLLSKKIWNVLWYFIKHAQIVQE